MSDVPILCQFITISVEILSLWERETFKIENKSIDYNIAIERKGSASSSDTPFSVVINSAGHGIRRLMRGMMWEVYNRSDECRFDVYFSITISVITLTPEYVFTSETRTLKHIYSNSPMHSSPDRLLLMLRLLLLLMVALICEWTRLAARILSGWKPVRR